jgi:hypothetical protein
VPALRNGTRVVAVHMLRIRAGADVDRRLRADLVGTALAGSFRRHTRAAGHRPASVVQCPDIISPKLRAAVESVKSALSRVRASR